MIEVYATDEMFAWYREFTVSNACFYDRIVPAAEKIWEQYLVEQKAGKHD